MPRLHAPKTENELADMIANGNSFAVEGLGSKRAFGRVVSNMPTLSLAGFSGVQIYEPEELILEAGAATPLADIQKLLAERQQMLAAFWQQDLQGRAASKQAVFAITFWVCAG
jgi:glycolate oxidase FAD binding subunit